MEKYCKELLESKPQIFIKSEISMKRRIPQIRPNIPQEKAMVYACHDLTLITGGLNVFEFKKQLIRSRLNPDNRISK